MKNPWQEISLDDYENHMKLDSVRQLQTMNEMMKEQFAAYPASSVMILGIAGGNGLEHISQNKWKIVYGVDINSSYLRKVSARYPDLQGILKCLCMDLTQEAEQLPNADLLIANLLIEYIGYECFKKAVRCVAPRYVSCIIQINTQKQWVSDSPWLSVFDGLEQIHHQMDEPALKKAMREIHYRARKRWERCLPDGKKLVRIDFEKNQEDKKKNETNTF